MVRETARPAWIGTTPQPLRSTRVPRLTDARRNPDVASPQCRSVLARAGQASISMGRNAARSSARCGTRSTPARCPSQPRKPRSSTNARPRLTPNRLPVVLGMTSKLRFAAVPCGGLRPRPLPAPASRALDRCAEHTPEQFPRNGASPIARVGNHACRSRASDDGTHLAFVDNLHCRATSRPGSVTVVTERATVIHT